MKSSRLSGDIRLALPTLGAWLVLVAVINISELHSSITTFHVEILVGLFFVLGLIGVRKNTVFGLWCFITAAFLQSCGFKLASHVQRVPWIKDEVTDEAWWSSWAIPLRSTFLSASEQLPGVGGQLIPGLAIGDTSRLSDNLVASMKTVSLTHITAVSGANCVLVTASAMLLLSLVGAHRKIRLIGALVTLFAFVVLVTPQPSVLRAATMASIVMFSLYRGRPSAGIPILASACIVLLLWDPWLSVDFGMILSAAATAGLLLFAQPLTHSLSRWMPQWLALVVSVPLAAQLACQPFVILLTPQFPTYGVLANLIAAPAAPVATMLGLLACLLYPWATHVAVPLLWLSWVPAEWVGFTAQFFSTLPHASIPWSSGFLGALSMAAISVIALLALISQLTLVRRVATVLLILVVSVWVTTQLVTQFRFTQSLPTDWDIAACDVGQGDGLIVRSDNRILVIDVGRKPEPMRHCFTQLGITHIDLLVLTHFDKDHVGGLEAVVGKVDHAIVGKPENSEDSSLLAELSQSGAQVSRGHSGMRGSLGHVDWHVLWPDGRHPTMEMGNPGSITLLVEFPRFNAIFLGDLGQEAQRELLNSSHVSDIDVVKVAHHGSADQSPALYEALQPEIGIFSVGADNDYGHPRQETLDILNKLHARTPRTDLNGLIIISSTASTGLSVWTEH